MTIGESGTGAATGDGAVTGDHVPPRLERLQNLEMTPRRIEQRRLAAAARAVIEHLVSTDADLEELTAAADRLEEMAEVLRALPGDASYSGFAEVANAGSIVDDHRAAAVAGGRSDDAYAFFDHSPLIGLANPLSPPLTFEFDAEQVRGFVTFGSAYEGPPGCVHGGYVAAAFDELLGAAQSLTGTQGMTARLEVNYRSPTPLHQPLRMEAFPTKREGRKIFCEGRLWHGERLCAESTALFISLGPERFGELLAARGRRDLEGA
jgi:acyl-coenzyme A thioesterase PaaI-like protein